MGTKRLVALELEPHVVELVLRVAEQRQCSTDDLISALICGLPKKRKGRPAIGRGAARLRPRVLRKG